MKKRFLMQALMATAVIGAFATTAWSQSASRSRSACWQRWKDRLPQGEPMACAAPSLQFASATASWLDAR